MKHFYFTCLFLLLGSTLCHATDYFTVTAEAPAAKISLTNVGTGGDKPSLQCSTDGGATWSNFVAGSNTVTLTSVGDKAMFRGTNPAGFSRDYAKGYKFAATAKISVSGNIMTLVDGDNPSAVISSTACFANLFNGCTNLVSSEGLMLPATRLAPFCYYRMFYGCTALVSPPKRIEALSVAESGCLDMFRTCRALTAIPVIYADTIGESGCENMFMGCTSLVAPQDIRAKVIGIKGCSAMFSSCTAMTTAPAITDIVSIGERGCFSLFASCTSLTSVPDLQAKTIGECGYREMFNKCTSLTTAPEIKAAVIGKYGCYKMYAGCSALVSSPDLKAESVSTNAYQEMFAECGQLTAAPYIAAKVIGISTCSKMFYNCKKLSLAQASLPATAVSDSGCYSMFEGCTVLTHAVSMPSVKVVGLHGCHSMYKGCTALTTGAETLAATRVMNYGYAEMYRNCSKLTTACETLPAEIIGNYAYQYMFGNCALLTAAPEILATNIGTNSMAYMFSGCKALTTVQKLLPATRLTNNCYQGMFSSCTALTTAPELPAMTLANYCYNSMFSGCTALVNAPVLPALSLTYDNNGTETNYTGCYSLMFNGCKALKEIEVHFTSWGLGTGSNTDTSNKYPTNRWLDGVAANGTFRAPCQLENIRGVHNIPANWQFECMVSVTFDVNTNEGTWDDGNTDSRMLFVPLDEIPQAYKEGCLFTGWNTSADGTGTKFELTNQPVEATTYFAQFRPIAFDVVDWQNNLFVVRTTATDIVSIDVQAEGSEKKVSNALADCLIDNPGVYALSFNRTDVYDRFGGRLNLTFRDNANTIIGYYVIPIPVLVDDATNSSSFADLTDKDIWVLDGGQMTIDGSVEAQDLYVSGGGKLVVPTGCQLAVNRLVLRGGRLNDDGSYSFCYPQLVANGAVRTFGSVVDYEYLVSDKQYYSLALPYTVNIKDVAYLDGSRADLVVMRYNGLQRTSGQTGWQTMWNPFTGSNSYPNLEAGVGYTIYGVSPQVKMENTEGTAQRVYCYLRFPMQVNLMLGERSQDGSRTVSVTPYGITANTLNAGVRPNDAGWNLVGNPYLADYNSVSTLNGASIIGLLQMQDGEYVWVGNQRYVVIPSDDGRTYTPALAANVALPAFRNFFVQIGTGDVLSFDITNRAQNAPARMLVNETTASIELAGNGEKDIAGLLFADGYTADYEFNADLAKWSNAGLELAVKAGDDHLSVAALPRSSETEFIPLSVKAVKEADYTFSLTDDLGECNTSLYLYDAAADVLTDLTRMSYCCYLGAGRYDDRFFVSAVPPRTPTAIEQTTTGTMVQAAEGEIRIRAAVKMLVSIYDVSGKCLYSDEIDGDRRLPVDKGVYIVNTAAADAAGSVKIIIR